MHSNALAAGTLPPALAAPSAGFDYCDLRIFARVPEYHWIGIVPLRGEVVIYDTEIISREPIREGALYVRETQHPYGGMGWDRWLKAEIEATGEEMRGRPRGRLHVSREVVQAVRWPRGDAWALRLSGGFTDGPYNDWAFGFDLVGKVIGVYRPEGGGA